MILIVGIIALENKEHLLNLYGFKSHPFVFENKYDLIRERFAIFVWKIKKSSEVF